MEVRVTSISPIEHSIYPALSFELEVSHIAYEEIIIGINGWLKTDDGKIIANLTEALKERERKSELGAKDSSFDKNFSSKVFRTNVIAFLNSRSLSHIESRRMMNRKGDVQLILELNLKVFKSETRISHLHEVEAQKLGIKEPKLIKSSGREETGTIIFYAYDPEFSSNRVNRWVLSGKGSPVFLASVERCLETMCSIPSSDWIHDYAPKLGLGEFFVVEIPKGEETIKEAWNLVNKAEDSYRRWDTKGVFANCREAGYLLDRIVESKFGKESFIYKERWGRAYGRFEHLASLDLHLENIKKSAVYPIDEVKINKVDAEHILLATKLLVKLAENLLRAE